MRNKGLFIALWLSAATMAQAEVMTVTMGQSFSARGETGDVSLAPRIRSSLDLPTPELIQARKAMVQKRRLSLGLLRGLADAGDGLAAYQLAERLAAKGRSDLAADTAHYYAIAAAKGRGYAVRGMVAAIDQIDNQPVHPRRLSELKKVLMAYVKVGHPTAIKATFSYHLAGHPFGNLSQDMTDLALTSKAPATGGIALQLASAVLQEPDATVSALTEAQALLDAAQQSLSISVSVTAANLLPLLNARLGHTQSSLQEPK